MVGGGKQKTHTETVKNEPWAGAQPYLHQLYGTAWDEFQKGTPNYFPGQNYIDQSQATTDSLAQMEALARAGSPLNGQANGALSSILTGGQSNQNIANTHNQLMAGTALGTNPAAAGAAQMAQGGQNPAMAGWQAATGWNNPAARLQAGQAMQLAGSQNSAIDMLNKTADGSMLNSNPYLEQSITNANRPLIEQFNEEVAPGIDSRFVGAGRMNSNAFANVRNRAETTLADAMTRNAETVRSANYTSERSNQLAAQNTIGNLNNQDVANRLNANSALATTANQTQAQRLAALQGQGSTYNAAFANRLQALGLQSDIYGQGVTNTLNERGLRLDAANGANSAQNANVGQLLSAIGMAPALREFDFANANMLGQVGASRDAYQDLILQAEMGRHDQEQNKIWDNVGRMGGLLTGGGYNTQTSSKPVYSNGASQALGTAASIASIFSMFCDRRAKENIRHIGKSNSGHNLYSFTYIGAPDKIVIGPMADEVEETNPDAVFTAEDGYKRVLIEELHNHV